jgi:hypothetical protein
MQDKALAELLGAWTMLEQREERPTDGGRDSAR